MPLRLQADPELSLPLLATSRLQPRGQPTKPLPHIPVGDKRASTPATPGSSNFSPSISRSWLPPVTNVTRVIRANPKVISRLAEVAPGVRRVDTPSAIRRIRLSKLRRLRMQLAPGPR